VHSRVLRPNVVEALALALVIAIAWSFASPRSFRPMIHRRAMAASEIDVIESALGAYRYDGKRYPSTTEGLAALIGAPGTKIMPERPRGLGISAGSYLARPVPSDPWGHPYVYRHYGAVGDDGYFLASYGADRKPGGEGEDADIVVNR